ncbi:MAG: serine hydrolase [Verrucomicrobiota bacterium]|nr:serine hydrolase [Verrucomicrobiota bacterium]
MNKTEKKNQKFKKGKGKKSKCKDSTRQPKVKGNIDSILIAKNGKLILEEYFADANVDKLHYQMSITKSITANAIGKAIDLGIIKSENDFILNYLPEVDKSKIAKGTEKLKISDLLSMQSGIRFKGNKAKLRKGVTKKNHVELYLINTSQIPENKNYKYDGTNPSILLHILYNKTGKILSEFTEEYFFNPMGIKKYKFNKSICGIDAGAAGMELRSRDMLKIGLMIKDGGVWNGKRLLSKEWVDKKTAVHANADQPNHYEYFWWIHEAKVEDKTYDVKSARGA